ncbi:MAG: tetratricopeptide repeat protein [Deltaproteobacteria bacterium]|nr:tetratricopeptide repeat protein [Deltaproteobacteria bacterium]
MKPFTLLLFLLFALEARAQTAPVVQETCSDCWTDRCPEQKGYVPKCALQGAAREGASTAGPTATVPVPVVIKKKVRSCQEGRVSTSGGSGCCWPGQTWAKNKCAGPPKSCPTGRVPGSSDCVVQLKGDVDGAGRGDKKSIITALRRRNDGFQGCYEIELRQHPGTPAGKVVVEFALNQKGHSTKTLILTDTIGSDRLGKCVTSLLDRMSFPSSNEQHETFVNTFEFPMEVAQKPGIFFILQETNPGLRFSSLQGAPELVPRLKRLDELATVVKTSNGEARARAIAEEKQLTEKLLGAINRQRYVPADPVSLLVVAELYRQRALDEEELGQLEQQKLSEDAALNLYRSYLEKYPAGADADVAGYLLGMALQSRGASMAEGIAVWEKLVQQQPGSRFAIEVWFRLGDFYFDVDRLPEAIGAYLYIISTKDEAWYDKALYKVGWTYYRLDRFGESVARFFELLDWSSAQRAGGGEGSSLGPEAIQYLALCFGDGRWHDDAVVAAVDYFATRRGKPWERDVMVRLGDDLLEQSRTAEAVAAFARALELDPLHVEAPDLHAKTTQAWVRQRDFDKAALARAALVTAASPGGPWALRFAKNGPALQHADQLVHDHLYSAALYHHQQASRELHDEHRDQALAWFRLASDEYRDFLARYPADKNADEISFYLAETYFYSGRFAEAVKEYEKGRDKVGNKYGVDCSMNAVYSYEKLLEEAMAKGTLEKREPSNTRDPARQPEAIPPLRQAYAAALDKVTTGTGAPELAASFAWRAGEVLYSYGHYDVAVTRFRALIDKYPATEAARSAAHLILDDLLTRKEWQRAADAAAAFAAAQVGGSDVQQYERIQSAAVFNVAKDALERGGKMMESGQVQDGIKMLESGADLYLKLIQEDPKGVYADVMMYNAALSFEKARRPARAAALYERLTREHPTSQYAPEALFRVASKSEQAFDFDKAVSTYLALVARYPKAERRSDAQINAALALEGQGQADRAAQELERYATLFPANADAADVFFRASIVHRKRNNAVAEAAVLRRFIARYGQASASASLARVIEANARLGDVYAELAKKTPSSKAQSVSAYQAAVAGFARAPPPKPMEAAPAAYFAAKSAFALAEDDFVVFARPRPPAGSSAQVIKEFQRRIAELSKVEARYRDVITRYKSAEWSLASLYRIGAIYDVFQREMIGYPCPAEVTRLAGEEGCDAYRSALDEKAFSLEEKAVEHYKAAVDKSREIHISNAWTKKALAALNLLRGSEYPIDDDALSPARRPAPFTVANVAAGATATSCFNPGAAAEALVAGDIALVQREAIAALQQDERCVPALHLMALAFMASHRFDTALFALQNALAIEPASALLQLELGRVQLKLSDDDAALAAFQAAVRLRPDLADAQALLAAVLLKKGSFAEALVAAQALVAREPNDASAQVLLGNARRGQKDYRGAQEAYARALVIDPQHVEAHVDLGLLYFNNEVPGVDALTRLTRALEELKGIEARADVAAALQSRLSDVVSATQRRVEKEHKRIERAARQK